MAKLLWETVTSGQAHLAHRSLPLSFVEWFELVNWLLDELDQPPQTPDSPALPTSPLREKLIELTDHEWFTLIKWVSGHTKMVPVQRTLPKPTSNDPPDSSPDKTGNNRDTESEDSNDPVPPPPDSPSQTISNDPPDPSPDKTGNNSEAEFEESHPTAAPPPDTRSYRPLSIPMISSTLMIPSIPISGL
jgi:hypothetical protein